MWPALAPLHAGANLWFDQTAFKPHIGAGDAFVVCVCVCEAMCCRSKEWNSPMWFPSLDLKKVFDRVEHYSLLHSLQEQRAEILFRNTLYCGISIQASKTLFLVNLWYRTRCHTKWCDQSSFAQRRPEICIAKMETSSTNYDFQIDGVDRLTNTSKAHDTRVSAKSMPVLVNMLELLLPEFAFICFELNLSKT